jgi:hypothetical protein
MTKKRKTVVLGVLAAAGLCLSIAYQAIKSLVEGNPVMGENTYGQPLGPAIQLLVLLVVLFVAVVSAWQYWPLPPFVTGQVDHSRSCFTYSIPCLWRNVSNSSWNVIFRWCSACRWT